MTCQLPNPNPSTTLFDTTLLYPNLNQYLNPIVLYLNPILTYLNPIVIYLTPIVT